MNGKKIAFIIPSLPVGGSERVLTSLACEMVKNNDVSIITLGKVIPFYKLDDRIKLLYCVDKVPPSKNIFQAIRSNYILLRRLNSILKQNKYDVLIGFLTTANVLTCIAGAYRKIPVIISERNNPFKQLPQKSWQILRRLTYPWAKFLVVQTEEIGSFYKPWINNSKLIILPNPISAELSAKRDSGIEKQKIVLNVGRLTAQKAQDVLIRSFAKTSAADWKLIVAGNGKRMDQYKTLIKDLGVEQRVELPGSVTEVENLYNKASIFAFSSVSEGFPNALIEAMHFGVASISTDCPTGPAELISDGENGFLIPINDEDALTARLDRLMGDPDLRRKFGQLSKGTVTKFQIENVVSQWEDLIIRAL